MGDRDKRSVIVDEERAPLITWAFEEYATGKWSLNPLLEELTARGLPDPAYGNTVSKATAPIAVAAHSDQALLQRDRHISRCGLRRRASMNHS